MARRAELSEQVLRAITETEAQDIVLTDDGFFEKLTGDAGRFGRRAARLVGLLLVLIAVVVFVIHSAVYYTQTILLPTKTMNVNRFGAFSIQTSPNREYALFLFNSAVAWQPSGIQVYEGDEVFISASGGYHTKISQLVQAAKENTWADIKECCLQNPTMDEEVLKAFLADTAQRKHLARYVFMSRSTEAVPLLEKENIKIPHPHGLDDDAWFGDALFQVTPEHRMRDTEYADTARIYAIPRPQKEKKHKIIIAQSGIMTFCVNDSNPFNNIGQVLVVMEIYHPITWGQAIRNFFTAQPFEVPYFLYDKIEHRGDSVRWDLWATLVLLSTTLLQLGLYCLLLYCLPFLFVKETWIKIQTKFTAI